MKIVKVEDLHCDAGWRVNSFLKITTDEGIVGWSEYMEGYGAQGLTGVIQKLAESRWLTLMHLLPLSGAILPGSNILLPLICWIIKKDEYEEYDIHGRAVLNFQLTMTMIFIPTIVLMVFYFPVGFPLFVLLGIYILLMPILNAVRVTSGKKIRYPLSIPFLRKYPRR